MGIKITHNKLVRDKIPEIIFSRGGVYDIYRLNKYEFKNELQDKLEEEVKEFLEASKKEEPDSQDCAAELSDILEVVYALGKIYGFEESDLDAVRDKKRIERGAFESKLFLLWSRDGDKDEEGS